MAAAVHLTASPTLLATWALTNRSAVEGVRMESKSGEAVLHLSPAPRHDESLRLVDVEGELGRTAVKRWVGLLRGVIEGGARGIAVDLRGCRLMDSHCLAALLAASQTLKSRGGRGVTLVLFPGSRLARHLKLFTAGGELPAYDNAAAAIWALS
jgi:anti-anti-sigma regulatory factor